jgi:hypothetical protein
MHYELTDSGGLHSTYEMTELFVRILVVYAFSKDETREY